MKTIRRLALITLLLIALFTAMITAVFCIPTSAVRENVEKSAMQIEKDGLWYKPLGFFLFQIDNMTDCQMLLINATADSDRPMWAAMMAEEYISITDSLHPYNALTGSTKTMAKEGRKPGYVYSDYARYWHGYQIFLRPLLTVFSYHTILAINYTLLALLILFVLYATYKTLGIIHASTLAASLILTNVFIVPLALQFSTCYYIFLLAMAFFMLKPDYAIRKDTCIYTFFIIGGVTSFMDFLTTPLLTLAMPLLTLMALNQGRDPYRKPSILHTSMAWGAGYAIIWISKWCVGTLLTGHDIFSSALGNAQLRVGNTLIFGGRVISINDFIQKDKQHHQPLGDNRLHPRHGSPRRPVYIQAPPDYTPIRMAPHPGNDARGMVRGYEEPLTAAHLLHVEGLPHHRVVPYPIYMSHTQKT